MTPTNKLREKDMAQDNTGMCSNPLRNASSRGRHLAIRHRADMREAKTISTLAAGHGRELAREVYVMNRGFSLFVIPLFHVVAHRLFGL